MTRQEREAQLERIAEKLLRSIESGQYSASDRAKLIKGYAIIDRLLQGYQAGIDPTDDPLLKALNRWDEAAEGQF